MGRDSLYIDLNDWIHDFHPDMTETRIEMIRSLLEELKIDEEDEVVISGDFKSIGLFFNYLISISC
jgi:hypothetical protein